MGGGNKQRQPRVKGNLNQAATLLGTDTAAINAFKVNPALAFSQFGSAAAAQGGGRLNWSQSHDGTPNSQESPAPRTASGADGRSLNCKSQQLSPSSSEASISDIDGELASLLKRLTKQDAQTRLKAIKEVSAYVEGRDAKQLNGMLLAWPSPYRRHIIDIDRRVRGEVAKVHYQLVTKMGKRLAPRLKEVIGPWVLGFFDQSREVASYSRMAFEDAFSPSRREEVFAYCLDDLAEFIRSNLHDELPDTLSDPRFLDKDQRQSKYEQVVACSFRGLGKVFDLLNKDTLEKRTLCEPLQAILGDQRTWKFASSSSSLVRSV
ncbi:listerin E3 ubiquitin protein ligase 1 [Spiromyces aspiralis]|uniref:Listerin E3 ubiquitin protein ligase 1 n=1 Tax=Spiromyces aspiralis TaxID=68401 RepID=A0ACC1HNN2_9FUNG|nr:listerin E3 ubiquitin protein ligase 1 [Spiromyces aspiralis]